MLSYLSGFSVIAAVFLILGIALLVLEMFIPGFGLPGTCGAICLAVGIFVQARTWEEALMLLLFLIAILGIALFIVMRITQKHRFDKSPIVLNTSINPEPISDMTYFVGRRGVVSTPLRPSGIADFDGVRLDVLAEAAFVPAGETVEVIRAEGNRIVVRKVTE